MDKEVALQKFLEEHPEFKRYSPSHLERSLVREKRIERKLEVLLQIADLKFKKRKTVEDIADTIGLSPVAVYKKIQKYLR